MALWALLSGCATPQGAGTSIDVRQADGAIADVGALQGKVLVLDVCASWASACNLNARVLDEVQAALPGAPLEVITLLLDDDAIGAVARDSYASVLGVRHAVFLAGPRVRSGTSALGDVSNIPRVVVIDRQGRIAYDAAGGVVSVEGLVERIKPLL